MMLLLLAMLVVLLEPEQCFYVCSIRWRAPAIDLILARHAGRSSPRITVDHQRFCEGGGSS